MPDGHGLLALDSNLSSNYSRQQIVFVSYPEGRLIPVTRDTNDYSDLSVASNGQLLGTILSEGHWNLSVMSATSSGGDARQIGPASGSTNFTWMRDGRLIDDKDGTLYWVNPDSGAKGIFVTEPDSASSDPSECFAGRYIVFDHGQRGGKGSYNIWRADAAGGNLKQLSNGKLDHRPICSSDGQWVYYLQGNFGDLMRVPIDGGAPHKVTDLPNLGTFDISPDGSTVAFATINHAGGHEVSLALIATDTGKVGKPIKFEREPGMGHLSPDGKALVYVVHQNGVDNLWRQPLDGSPGTQITSFTSEHIYDFHWSPDGSRLAMVRGHNDSDVVLIRNERQ
jgi:Tol biopolymer transport system component